MKHDTIHWRCPACHRSYKWTWERGDATEAEITMLCPHNLCNAESKCEMRNVGVRRFAVFFKRSRDRLTQQSR